MEACDGAAAGARARRRSAAAHRPRAGAASRASPTSSRARARTTAARARRRPPALRPAPTASARRTRPPARAARRCRRQRRARRRAAPARPGAGARAARRARTPTSTRSRRHVRSVAQQPLHEHAVAPLAVEAPVPALDPDLLESRRDLDRPARGIGREDARRELVIARPFGDRAQLAQQLAPDPAPARGGRDLHTVLPHAAVDAAIGVVADAGEAGELAPASSATTNGSPCSSHAATSAGSRGLVSKVASRPAIPSL